MTTAAPRRTISVAVAIALVAGSLLLVGAASASASNASNASKVVTALNKYRTDHALTKYVQNRYLTAYAQDYAEAMAACKAKTPGININQAASCADSVSLKTYAPNGSSSSTQIYASLSGSNLESRLAAQLTTDFAAYLGQAQYNFVGVGYFVSGGTGYVVAKLFRYVSLPFAHYGTVTVTSHPVVGVPVKPTFHDFSPTPASYQYVWYSNDTPVASNTPTYTPQASDVGHTIHLVSNALKPGYVSQNNVDSPNSHPVALGTLHKPSNPKIKVIGTFNVGQYLYFTAGPWMPTPDLQVQWLRNGKVIAGATADSYLVQTADKGKRIDFRESATLAGYHSTTATSRTTKKIGAPLLTQAPTPSFFGTDIVGHVLTLDTEGSWGPTPVHLSYAWTLGGKKVKGATKTTFTLPPSAAEKEVAVVVTGTKSGFAATSRTSSNSFVEPAPWVTIGTASISGGHTVGDTLTAGHGTWSPTPTSYSYEWLRNGLQISGASKRTYKLKSADAGKTIQVEVRPHRSGYESVTILAGVVVS